MFIPESPGPNEFLVGGQVVNPGSDDELDALVVPRTIIDHLLSEDERLKEAQARIEFEAVGLTMTDEEVYSIVHESACEKMTVATSHDEIQAEMMVLAGTPLLSFVSIIRQAYEDVLAGRPPKFSSPI